MGAHLPQTALMSSERNGIQSGQSSDATRYCAVFPTDSYLRAANLSSTNAHLHR